MKRCNSTEDVKSPLSPKRVAMSPPVSPSYSARRALKSPKKPREAFQGYVIHLGQLTTGLKGNQYFDVMFQHKSDAAVQFRVMVFANEHEEFKVLRETVTRKGGSLFVEGISTSSDTWFFNSRYGSTMVHKEFTPHFAMSDLTTKVKDVKLSPELLHCKGRVAFSGGTKSTSSGSTFVEGTLVDETGQIAFTLWAGKYENVQEKACYHVTNLTTKIYDGLKLATTRNSEFERIEQLNLDWDMIEQETVDAREAAEKKNVMICRPVVIGVEMDWNKFCSKPTCRVPVPADSNLKVYTCTSCEKTLKLDKLQKVFSGSLEVQESEEAPSQVLHLDDAVLKDLYALQEIDDLKAVKERLVLEEDIDIMIKPGTRQVLKITRHQDEHMDKPREDKPKGEVKVESVSTAEDKENTAPPVESGVASAPPVESGVGSEALKTGIERSEESQLDSTPDSTEGEAALDELNDSQFPFSQFPESQVE